MRFFLRLLGATAIALLLGLAITYWTVAVSGTLGAAIKNGPWATDLRIGGDASSLQLRAQIALVGLFALKRSETIYFGATEDSEGVPLDGACTYRIEGSDLETRWWSITSYGTDHFLIPNAQERYSISKTSVSWQANGQYIARLSTTPLEGNWIPTSREGFSLTLRLYQPSKATVEGLDRIALPRIVKEVCQ